MINIKQMQSELIEARNNIRTCVRKLIGLTDMVAETNKNVTKVFNEKEDIYIEIQKLREEIASVRKPIEEFLANFSVVEDIDVIEKQSKSIQNEDGTEVTSIGKTIDSERTFDNLADIGSDVLRSLPKIKIDNGQ